MRAKNLLFGVGTGAILIGSLVGVGCKDSSTANSSTTQTAEMMHEHEMATEEMMHGTATEEQMMHETATEEQMMHETPTP